MKIYICSKKCNTLTLPETAFYPLCALFGQKCGVFYPKHPLIYLNSSLICPLYPLNYPLYILLQKRPPPYRAKSFTLEGAGL